MTWILYQFYHLIGSAGTVTPNACLSWPDFLALPLDWSPRSLIHIKDYQAFR